ncbi:hypothetical protein [Inhella proteolytica]|uniref:Uncharacterized protein n=1 Tax=Inhella proteolytica TaxID=2795029 RepID=A0A931NHW4_9BURK|nr:hypothetical protein [Inhella proteolytica]MBH9578671.1 hypothetical protein [Inhella proteolytica]
MSFRTPADFSAKLLRLVAVTSRSEATEAALRWARQHRRGRAWLLDLQAQPEAQDLAPLADSPRALSRALVRLLLEGKAPVDSLPTEPAIPGLDVMELPGLEWVDPPLESSELPAAEGTPK